MKLVGYFVLFLTIENIRAENNKDDKVDIDILEEKHVENSSAVNDNDHSNDERVKQGSSERHNISVSKRDIFYAGFQVKRVHQLTAAKQLLSIKDYSKQYKMVKVIIEKLFQVLADSKLKISQSSYIPGHDFPEKEEDLDALAHVVENTAFFGDVLLRLPDITHKIIKGKREWNIIINWSIGFCNETGIFDKANQKLLDLVAQELELVPRDPAYVNPYKAESQFKAMENNKNEKDQRKVKRKKNKDKKKKGPRISRSDL